MIKKWTKENRELLFKRVYQEFGSVENWQSRTNPTGDKDDYVNFLSDMSVAFSTLTRKNVSPKGVKQQIDWAVQHSQKSCQSRGHVYNFIMNRAAAIEAGVIKSSDLPEMALFEVKKAS